MAEAMNHANVGVANEWVSKLLRIVAGQLSLAGRSGDLEAFRDRPGDRARRMSLVAALVEQLIKDEAFCGEIRALIGSIARATGGTGVHVHTYSADRGSVVNTGSGNVSILNKKVHIGGVAVPVGVLIAGGVAIVALGGWGVSAIGGGASSLSGASTCSEWLAADPASEASILKKLYLDASKPQYAADPFIVQNGQYFCGQNPKVKLDQIVAARP
ncbi:hypothetical protein [Amycolatopsis vastitatis]|nr:hypothetical protein [Amycolatopsis vastitatis]